MLVAIDAGNTEVKAAIVRDGRVISVRRVPTRSQVARYDAEGLIADALGVPGDPGVLAGASGSIEAIVLASVVPPWTEAVSDLATRLRRPLLEATAHTIPIKVRGPDRARVGADRLLDAFAAVRLHGAPVIVVDLGTATTIDAVADDGAFLGGAIAPGLELGLTALATGTAQLPRIAPIRPERAIGRDTSEAMISGAVLGHVGAVGELIRRIGAEMQADGGRPPRIVITGGLSTAPWIDLLGDVDAIDPLLTLKGLALLHAEVGTVAVP